SREAARRRSVTDDAHPQPMWSSDAHTHACPAATDTPVHHYAWTPDEFLGMTIMDLLPAEDADPPASVSDLGPLRSEVALAHHQRRDGTLVDMEIVSHEMELDGRRARLVLATDISDRTRTRAALHQSAQQLRLA